LANAVPLVENVIMPTRDDGELLPGQRFILRERHAIVVMHSSYAVVMKHHVNTVMG
jgi:hypothetical protein